jgi:hypothetical protein
MKNRILNLMLITLVAIFLHGCGGGSKKSNVIEDEDVPPIVEVGENELLKFKNKMIKRNASLIEYQYLGKFYIEVLENIGLIDGQNADDYMDSILVVDSLYYQNFITYLNNIDVYIEDGSFEDVVFLNDFKEAMELLFSNSTDLGELSVGIINELSIISNGVLPSFVLSQEMYTYDIENDWSSRFKGNSLYGSYQNGEWIFENNYKFLNAIVELAKEDAEKKLSVIEIQ